MKVIGCPNLQELPQVFLPQKLEISRCHLSSLPRPELARRLQHLALDSPHDGTLVRAIPSTSSLYSLVISNISNLACLPKWPHLPGLKVLYVHNCNDLVSLFEEEAEEESLQSMTSLQLLSVRGCHNLVKFPERGLPTTLECLSVGFCSRLQDFGPTETLKNLTSLRDLYIEDCPQLQSFPNDGLPNSLQHLLITKCPQLTEGCLEIKDVPDPEIDLIPSRPAPQLPKKKAPSAPWYRHLVCCKGLNPKKKMELGESSTSAVP